MKSIDETAQDIASAGIAADFPRNVYDGAERIAAAIRAPLLTLRQQLTARLAAHSRAINALPEAMRPESFLWRDLGECQLILGMVDELIGKDAT